MDIDTAFADINSIVIEESAMETETTATPVVTITRTRKGGPRGATARCAPRHNHARQTLLGLVAVGPTSALQVLEAAQGGCNYADIMKVAREFVEAGTIVESKKGRKNTWTLPATEG